MTAVRPVIADDRRPVLPLLAAVAVPPAVVLGLIGLVGGPIVAVVVLVVVAAAVAVLVWSAAGRSVPAALGGVPADPIGHARLFNLVEGLCATAGLKVPDVRVLPAPGLNVAVAGTDPARSVVVVTSALLEVLSRVELEGVMAAAVAEIRRGEAVAPTVAAVTGIGVGRAVPRERDLVVDAAAVRLTRYPPGLRSALESFQSAGTEVPGVPGRTAHLWLAEPRAEGAGSLPAYRLPLRERIDALREL